MKELTVEELRQVQIDLLNHFDEKCRENGLTYSLCGGTLIGAVRHKGYIPWDDDIDVMMPRPDYEKFLRLSFPAPYLLQAPELLSKEQEYVYIYAKLMNTDTILIEDPDGKCLKSHVYMDIFPLDAIADDEETFAKEFRQIHKCVRYNYILEESDSVRKIRGLSLLRKIKWNFAYLGRCILPVRYFYYKAIRLVKHRDYGSARYLGHPLSEPRPAYRYPREIMVMDNHVLFEGREYSAMHDYKEFLRIHYGDYMQLPPVEERLPHDNIAYKKD